MNIVRSHVLVCGGTGCTSSGSEKLITEFNPSLKKPEYKTKSALCGPAVSVFVRLAR
jgi:NADH:ubiquinone oxidoreductase subunit E